SERSARLNPHPAAILVTPASPLTGAAVTSRSVTVPRPSWPAPLPPQAHTVPSDRSARLWSQPPATCVTPVSPVTWTGASRPSVVPSPRSPLVLSPHAQAVPSDLTARVWPCLRLHPA